MIFSLKTSLFLVLVACIAVAELAILRSLLFGRARSAEQQPLTGALAMAPRARRSVEIAWALIPAIGLALVLYLTWRAVDAPAAPAADATHSGATIGV